MCCRGCWIPWIHEKMRGGGERRRMQESESTARMHSNHHIIVPLLKCRILSRSPVAARDDHDDDDDGMNDGGNGTTQGEKQHTHGQHKNWGTQTRNATELRLTLTVSVQTAFARAVSHIPFSIVALSTFSGSLMHVFLFFSCWVLSSDSLATHTMQQNAPNNACCLIDLCARAAEEDPSDDIL